jgi:homogentisate 1,2-dioxygenase
MALSFKGLEVKPEPDYIQSRKIFFFNDDMLIGMAAPESSMKDYFFKNADADEMLFVHEGSGSLKSMYGTVDFEYGDYLVIPRGTVYQLQFETKKNKLLVVESHSPIRTPKRYRNEFGQLLEHSPFCERDFKMPHSLETHDDQKTWADLSLCLCKPSL